MKLVINNYKHGGSRVFTEDKTGHRNLICDTYGYIENQNEMSLKTKIQDIVKEFYSDLKVEESNF